jgi:hypothetical protein
MEEYKSEEWFKSLSWQHMWIDKMAGWWVGHFGKVESVIDFGAGDGWWPKAFHDLGAKAVAVELFEEAREYIPPQVIFFQHDLREPLWLNSRAQLTICLEVAEHLPQSSIGVFTETLVKHTKSTLLFSAARPGQPGTGHITMKDQGWWRERIERPYLKFSPIKTQQVRDAFENIVNDCFEFLPRNIQVFSRIR